MIRRLLIANRGEIARRIIRTCHARGIETVAVYSDADADMPHVQEANFAVRLGPAAAAESYLSIERIIAAARTTGADAIHPGYGFLSENTQLAAACVEAGLIFVGPPARAIEIMGDKAAARQLMADSGVPVLPGCDEDNRDDLALRNQADKIGYPLLIKAVAGGGGKGMRVVHQTSEFVDALHAARREAMAAFSDDQVLLERYLEQARHIEVQIFADQHGHIVHLFERDCSVQRRHQKIIEEAPAPGLTQAQREAAGQAAVQAARSIGYVGAGTVEFLFANGHFYFMEMNTRLQVEHPVTELITGEDLVWWQLCVAAGKPLEKKQAELAIHGAAMEVRVYAEDPWQDFMPSSGQLNTLRWPDALARVDSGYEQGNRVSSHYDPMLAKIICHADNREQARQKLLRALEATLIDGIQHNIGFLHQTLSSDAFASATLDTRLLERQPQLLVPPRLPQPMLALAGAVVMLHSTGDALMSADPWRTLQGWRPFGLQECAIGVNVAGTHFYVSLTKQQDGINANITSSDDSPDCCHTTAGRLHWRLDGQRLSVSLADQQLGCLYYQQGEQILLNLAGHSISITQQDHRPAAQAEADAGNFYAPMSGNVVALHVAAGDAVSSGQAVITLEAMKMEHTLRASQNGKISAIHTRTGEQVAEGKLLVEFSANHTDTNSSDAATESQ